ncbi:MAG TPA: hypothetical protein DC046_12945, partial [Rhodospirillaceae bacterium]|nr:hypothetical protein [Rhodospirillaceae bacterium]
MISTPETSVGSSSPFRLLTGCPRSGTSLLASELMRRYDIAIPFETHFIPVFHRWRWLYGDLSQKQNRGALLADVYRFTRIWLAASKTFDLEMITRASILSTEDQAADIVSESHDFSSLMHALFAAFAQRQGADSYADKSSFFAPVRPSRLAAALGPVKVVAVVRDGRDVFLSSARTWFGTANAVQAARLWARHISMNDAWADINGVSLFTLRYEDLVENPDEQLAAVARFLDLAPLRTPKTPFLAEAMASAPEHARLSQAVGPDSVNRNQRELAPWQHDA